MEQRFEHKVVDTFTLVSTIQEYEVVGWEVVGFSFKRDYYKIIFKRPYEELVP